jgi:hypothetical protein
MFKVQTMNGPPYVEMIETAPLGLCIICEERIWPKAGQGGRKRRICGRECKLVYAQIYSLVRNRKAREVRERALRPRS